MAKKVQQKKTPPAAAAVSPRLPVMAVTALLAVWLLVVLVNYTAQNGFFTLPPFAPPLWLTNLGRAGHLFKYVPQLLLLALFSASALLLGATLLRAVAGPDNKDIGGLDWLLFSLGLGFGALSLLTLGLGFAGQLNRPALLSVLGAACVLGAVRFRADAAGRLAGLLAEVRSLRFSGFDLVLLFLLALYGASALVWALAPEIFFDSLVYHLAVPSSYLQEGRVLAQPHNLNSAFPLLMQMLYAAGLLMSDDVLPKLMHFATGLFLLGTLFAMGRRWVSVTAGLLACVIFLSMPMALINMSSTGVEIGSAWFTALAVYALLLFSAREGGPGPVFDRTLLLAGLFAGLACGTKYPALFTVIAGGAVVLFRRPAGDAPRDYGLAAKQALLFGVAAALVFLPWPLKNLFFHGNPLYPFFGKLLGGQLVDPVKWVIFNSDCFSRDLGAAFRTSGDFFRFVFHPWYITMSGMGNADFVGPFLLVCLPLLLLYRLQKPALRHLALYLAVMWCLWALSTTMPRYFLPSLSLLSLLLAAVITESGSAVLKWTLQGALVVFSLYSAQWISELAKSQEGWRVVFGLQSRAEYLSAPHSAYPMPYYPAMEYINSSLPPDSRVLFAGDSRSFFCERKFIGVSVHDVHPLVLFARASSTPEEMQARVAAAGITHLFLNLGEAVRLDKSYRLFQWDDKSLGVFNAWWARYAEQLWSDMRNSQSDYRLLFVYRLVPGGRPAAAPQPHNYIYDLYLKGLEK
ncbi:MAG: hypothetical protein A2X31_11705 [Elusimicrobia bacterium GWB2_63_22]|nr:MAG: hypothetical protein A2X31_11705 [Elusimicrobia bacterium GWB2_63_22]